MTIVNAPPPPGRDWKRLVATVAPALATALGGPLAGVATQALSAALLGNSDGSTEEVATAVLTGGADGLLKIREADHAFAARMAELEIDLERVHQTDRASARDREAKTSDRTPAILAAAITIGFFWILWMMMRGGMPETGHDAFLVMLGSLGTAWTSVVSYFYGSSSGSARKTAALERMGGKP